MNNLKKGQNHIWLPYTQMQNHLPQLAVKKTRASKIYLKDGRTLIDGLSSWWAVSHGYNHPHLTKAIKSQVKKLPHIMLAGFANDQTYKLAYRLCKFSEMDRCFFSDSGSTAIEVAMKIAWQYYINLKQPKKTKFISFKNSYHGDTTGAMSLADLSNGMHQKFKDLLLDNFSLDLPKNESDLDKFDEFLKNNQNHIAGIFIEPLVQCAGGMKFCDIKIFEQIFLIAKKYDILFIADECAVGFYRTGKKFAYLHSPKVKPDILVVGKALTGGIMTLAATLTSQEIYQAFLGESLDLALMHGPTFMGNPLACSSANASLDIFEKSNYEEKIKKDEEFIKNELEKCRDLKDVIDVRVIGMIGVVEFKKDWSVVLKMRQEIIKYGVFLRPLHNCIYLMPPLNISRSDLKKICDVVLKILF